MQYFGGRKIVIKYVRGVVWRGVINVRFRVWKIIAQF